MFSILKKNSIALGLILALINPIVLFFLLSQIVDILSLQLTWGIQLVQEKNVALVSIFANLFIMYPYLHKEEYERTGRGVMLSTFSLALVYFYYFYRHLF